MDSFACRAGPLIRALVLSVLFHIILLSNDGLFLPVQLVANTSFQIEVKLALTQGPQLLDSAVQKDALASFSGESGRQVRSGPRGEANGALSSSHKHSEVVGLSTLSGESATIVHDAVNADAVRQYRMALAIQMHRYKSYPIIAREQGREGRAEVALDIMSNGLVSVGIVKSSGDEALDAQAMLMVEQGVGLLSLPEALRGKSLRLIFPLQFNLSED